MNLDSITLERFRSFRSPTNFFMPSPGLVLLTGPNGAGKSTLLEAPHWCFFGKTSRMLKAGNVANWKEPKRCVVQVKGTFLGKQAIVKRSWNPNVLLLNGKEVDQPTLERDLGFSPLTYTHAYHFPQRFDERQDSFLDLTPEKKMELLVELLRLHVWEKASDSASAEAEEFAEGIARAEGQLQEVEHLLEAYDLADLRLKEKNWNQEHAREVEQIKKSKVMIVPKLQKRIDSLAELDKEWRVKTAEHAAVNASRCHVRDEREEMARLKDQAKCPMCGAKLDKAHQAKELARLDKGYESATVSTEALRREVLKIETEMQELRLEITNIQGMISHNERCDAKLETFKLRDNPYTEQRKHIEEQQALAKERRTSLQRDLDKLRKAADSTLYWIKGFKEVRLLVVDSMLAQLEAEVNQSITELGLAGWQIKFDVEKENKSGGVKRGFSTLVLSPDNSDHVPWEVWSGGESQRLRLAGAFGFANLVHSVTGQSPNFELWDEPSNWLDPAGVPQLLNSLSARAKRYKRSVIVSDHRALSYGGFIKRINVMKDSQGSRIE